MFEAVTEGIKVEATPAFVREQSDPTQSHYFFSYKIRIENRSERPVQLVKRHWIIRDGFGQVEEVDGPGVVGLQPTIKPGEIFEYSSFCPLTTPTGSMQGTYVMVNDKGEQMEVQIPMFILCEPSHYH